MTEINRVMYLFMLGDNDRLNRKLTTEMLNYHSTALLWARLLDLKARRGTASLTEAERLYHRFFTERDVSIPQPIHAYLRAIGNIKDARGKRIHLANHDLPVERIGGKTGYHAGGIINEHNHNLYEEIPTLGVCGDMLMAVSDRANPPLPNLPIIPANRIATENLLGYSPVIPPRRDEIFQILAAARITRDNFPEAIPNTRFNYELFNYIDSTIKSLKTFKVETSNLSKMSTEGSVTQLIVTTSAGADNPAAVRWVNGEVQARTVSADQPAAVDASYFAGFQIDKRTYGGSSRNWACMGTDEPDWEPPNLWVRNRNV